MKLLQIAIWVDQGFNVFFGGYADETISARAYRSSYNSSRWNTIKNIIDFLFFWQDYHCLQSYLAEKHRKQYPAHYREDEE